MTNYNTIISFLKAFASNHKQINNFYDGQVWDFQAKDKIHASMIVTPIPATIESGQTTVTVQILMLDLQNKDFTNTTEIHSDTLQMHQDLFSMLYDSNEEWLIDDPVTPEPFERYTDDNLAGWLAAYSIKFPFTAERCNLPIV